jgi:hypothetical protein
MIQTTMEQTLSNGWPKRFMIRLTAYDITRAWEVGTRFILSLLTLTILFGLAGGVVKTFLDLRLLLSANVEVALRQVLVDTLTLLAVVEVLKTTLAYCSDGRVGSRLLSTQSCSDADGGDLTMVHGRGVASIRDTWRHLNHAGSHAHRGRPIQPAPTKITNRPINWGLIP